MAEQLEEYRSAVIACVMAARLLQQHDIPKLLRDIEHAESVGPIFNPTLWIQKNKAMEEDRKLLSAAVALRNALPTPLSADAGEPTPSPKGPTR